MEDLDIASYISKPWYVQKQMPLIYQPKDQLFCVRASYEPLDADDLTEGLRVVNYANRDRVNGEAMGTGGDTFFPLVASIPDPNQLSKLQVGPDIGFLPGVQQLAMGDYWIVAANGSKPGEYDWAIISGGLPKRETDNGCATGNSLGLLRRFQINDIGLWFFSRRAVDPQGTAVMEDVAQGLGLDTSELVDVQQEGCLYMEHES